MLVNKKLLNEKLNRVQQNPNDEYYTSPEEVDYVMSRLVKVLPKKTLWVFSADLEWSEFVKWAKAHHLESIVYSVDMFWSLAIASLRAKNYDKVCIVTNPPFSLYKYFLPLLNYLVRDMPDKVCYFLLGPITLSCSRFSIPLWTVPGHEVHQYVYPGKSLFYNNITKKTMELALVVFYTNINLDDLIPEPPMHQDYLAPRTETIYLSPYTLRFARSFAKEGYFIASYSERPVYNEFQKILWKKKATSV